MLDKIGIRVSLPGKLCISTYAFRAFTKKPYKCLVQAMYTNQLVAVSVDLHNGRLRFLTLDTPRKTLPRKSVFHLPQRYLRNVATRALPIVVQSDP